MQTKQDYAQQLNSVFRLEHDEGVEELTLIEVNGVTAEKTESGQSEAFSAVFRTNTMDAFDQGSYHLKHETFGEVLIFLVPIGPDDKGMRYEAIFT